jgi:hypothetical protein
MTSELPSPLASSQLAYGMVQHISMAKDTLADFSSGRFIALKYELRNFEANHEYMHPASYFNFVTRQPTSVIVYGLELTQVPFMESLRRIVERIHVRIRLHFTDHHSLSLRCIKMFY